MSDTDNGQDLIDSRDVIARIEELKLEWNEGTGGDNPDDYALSEDDWKVGLGDDGAEEIVALLELAEEGESNAGDWTHGATLIRDSYFVTYAKDLASDLGLIADDAQWPATHIDWDAAAEALQIDYTEIDYDGVAYWVRS